MKFFTYWIPVVVWMTIIFFLSSRESVLVSDQQTVNFIFFKTLHVIEYFLLYVIIFRGFKNTVRMQKENMFWAALIITVLYAATDELHQQFVPTREGKVRDVIIDAFGASLAWYSIQQLLPKAPKKLRALASLLQVS
jgi:VanZ family protein